MTTWNDFKKVKPVYSGVYLISYGGKTWQAAEWRDWMGMFYSDGELYASPLNDPAYWADVDGPGYLPDNG